ncbi:MAG: NAD(P)/FAD-dependent oxidoreductase, partial [Eubacteriaceae bacterium]
MDTDKNQKVLIVGGVAGGASAAARLRRLDEKAEIIMFEKGDYISFANCGLPYYIGGVIPDRQDLLLQTPQSFKARFNVDVRVRSTVTAIDPEQKTVTVSCDGKTTEESYDKLILSPGALPLRPPIPGLEMDRVFTVRNIPDTVAVKQFIDENNPREAVVIGAGFIGLEVAENLERLGIDVKIIEAADQILPPVDPETARMAQEYLNDQGITIHLNSAVTMVTADGSQLSVRTPGHEFSADFVILSIGVRPDSDIAEKAGLAVNEKGAIRVDER